MEMEYMTFSAPYGVCSECHWETYKGISDQAIVSAMAQHYGRAHGLQFSGCCGAPVVHRPNPNGDLQAYCEKCEDVI
ncbi:MAG: hypothetical protein OXI74_05775 [Rhodospirillaceae bacterium]|nr:hypothetical protein [Rhodospirillaceae bacterium]